MPMVGSKVRPTRPLPVFDGSSSIVKSPQKATEHNPLLIIGTVPPQLTFLRISDDGCSLLFSKMPNAEVADCSRVIPLSELRAVTVLSRHSFELKVVLPGLSVRLETHDAFSCKQWVLRLGSSVSTTDKSHAFPSRSTGWGGSNSPLSPRSRRTDVPAPPDANLNVASAHSRGWHVNSGQHGLQRLRELSPRTPSVEAGAARGGAVAGRPPRPNAR